MSFGNPSLIKKLYLIERLTNYAFSTFLYLFEASVK